MPAKNVYLNGRRLGRADSWNGVAILLGDHAYERFRDQLTDEERDCNGIAQHLFCLQRLEAELHCTATAMIRAGTEMPDRFILQSCSGPVSASA
jgi:hypothetical protein